MTNMVARVASGSALGVVGRRAFGVVAAAAMTIAAPAAHAASYVVDTGAGSLSNNSTDWSLSPTQQLAAYFTLGTATTIESIEGYFDGYGNAPINISIVSDGALPSDGTTLHTGSFTPDPAVTAGFAGIFGKNWSLAAGNYWLTFDTAGDTGLYDIATTPLTKYAFSNSGGWFTQPLAIAVRIGGTTGGPVPEPATWAMMILGFGFVGSVARRRRPSTRLARA